ncbi:hypothetical protein DL95DRAFT_460083 [Leptodontidium sp. 2 PMI_412]|nr:hypothetical protein DL95DRAFT_460083 [Leptodontidium sp. 2 PMI_412]
MITPRDSLECLKARRDSKAAALRSSVNSAVGVDGLEDALRVFEGKLVEMTVVHREIHSESLDCVLGELLQLIKTFEEADTEFLRGGTEGMSPERIATTLQHYTSQTRQKSTKLAQNMRVLIVAFGDELNVVHDLDEEVSHFSEARIGRVRCLVEDMQMKCEEEMASLNSQIAVVGQQILTTDAEISDMNSRIARSYSAQDKHETIRNVGIATSVVSGVGFFAAIGTIIFPPAIFLTAPMAATAAVCGTLSVGVGGTVGGALLAKDNDDSVDAICLKRTQDQTKVANLRSERGSLQQQSSQKLSTLSDIRGALSSISHVDSDCTALLQKYGAVRDNLQARSSVFSQVQLSLGDVASRLEMCGFVRTREKIGRILNQVLERLVGNTDVGHSGVRVQAIRRGILGLDERSSQVSTVFGSL